MGDDADAKGLEFLRSATSVYYAGLDHRGFPFGEAKKRIARSTADHLRYLKVLALLVDHVSVPPAFLVFAMSPEDGEEHLLRTLLEFFEARLIVTAVHSNMAEPLDFFNEKRFEGDAEERSVFGAREAEARSFFRQIPLFHRHIPSMAATFKDRFLRNLRLIPRTTLHEKTHEDLVARLEAAEVQQGALSRKRVIGVLGEMQLEQRRHLYRQCYYAMNEAYYRSGGATYHSDIACLRVEEYSIFSRFIEGAHDILVGYDPSLFLGVLRCHRVTPADVEALSVQELVRLKAHEVFRTFLVQYREFVRLYQAASTASERWSRPEILRLKQDLVVGIENRFHVEGTRLAKWIQKEDVGSGLFFSALGAVLGFLVAGPAGSIAGSGLGLVGPAMKAAGISASELIANKIACRQFAFYLYLEFLREKLAPLVDGDQLLRESHG